MKPGNIIIFLLICTLNLYSQNIKINGYIISASSGEPIINAHIISNGMDKHSISNTSGFFSLSLAEGKNALQISHVAYQPALVTVNTKKDTAITIELLSLQLGEIEVYGEEPLHRQTLSGKISISPQKIEFIPTFVGEPDIIKAITYLPGVSGNNKGFSNLYVRGGDRQNNLLLLDGAPVYSLNHLFGILSVFNADIIKNIDFYKGGFPARYGGRTSSVVDITTRRGNNKKLTGKFNIGILKSKLLLEGPVVNQRTSFILALRSSYLDLFTLPFRNKYKKGNPHVNFLGYTFYDINAKVTREINEKSQIFVNLYKGTDIQKVYDKAQNTFQYRNSAYEYKQENQSATIGLQSLLNSDLYFNTSVIYSKYGNRFEMTDEIIDYIDSSAVIEKSHSYINSLTCNISFDYTQFNNHKIKTGGSISLYKIQPGVSSRKSDIYFNHFDTTYNVSVEKKATEYNLYIEDEIAITNKLNINAGVRLNIFNSNYTHINPEPRISIRWLAGENISFKTGYSIMHQYMHLIESNIQGTGNELWVGSNKNTPPQKASLFSGGIFGKISHIEYGFEAFYKNMENLIYFNYIDADEDFICKWDNMILKDGKGRAYGFEALIKYKSKKFISSLSYTLAKNDRKFSDYNFNKWFPFSHDRRHDLTFLLHYILNEKNTVGINFVFNTGEPITLPEAYIPTNRYFNGYLSYNDINNMRLPAYHRLDISYKRNTKTKKGRKSYWSINLYNAYARRNPVYVYYDKDKVISKSLYSIIPSFNWGMEF